MNDDDCWGGELGQKVLVRMMGKNVWERRRGFRGELMLKVDE